MSAQDPTQDPTSGEEAFDDLAAEYVLGVLGPDDRRRAAERARAEPGFRAEIEAWERRLFPLLDEVAPVMPPERVWKRLEGETFTPARPAPKARGPAVWDQIWLWRGAAAALALTAAGLAVLVISPQPAMKPAARTALKGAMVARLANTTGQVLFTASLNLDTARVLITPVAALDSGGRAPELWLIPAGGKPEPVGLLDPDRAGLIAAPVLSKVAADATLAVSLEPQGGSPTGLPTGPVIASGVMSLVSD